MKNFSTLIKTILSVLLLFTGFITILAQDTPNQKYELGSKINEMTLTVGGVLVVATNDGLAGIKPEESKPIFTFNNFGKLKPEETEFIPGSPYIVVSQGANSKFEGLAKTKRAVIDYVQGKVIFNSDDDQWNQIYTCNVVLPENKLIVSGIQKVGTREEKMSPKVAVYNLNTSKLDYSFFLNEPGKVGISKDFSITGTPYLLKDMLIIPTAQGLIAKSHSGEDVWRNKIKGINWLVANETEKEIYGFETTSNGKNTRIHKIGSNGEELWEDDRKVKGIVSKFEILPQGLAVVSNVTGGSSVLSAKSESKITMFDAKTGEDLWAKAPKTKGYVQHFYTMDDGILFGIYSGGVNKISYDGKTLFKKPLKTGENILTMAETPQGLIYITSEDANIVNLQTGEEVWKKPLKYKNTSSVASTFDRENNRYLIAAGETLYAIDAASGKVSELSKIKFDEKESPNNIQIRNNNIFLSSSQNLMSLNSNGSKNFHGYYKSPGKSGFMKIVGGVVAAASLVATVSTAAAAGANRGSGSMNNLRSYNDYGKDAKRASDMFANISSASFKMMSQRFKASSATENSQFILTKLKSGVGLVVVNKDSGSVEKEILLKDKKPEYKVDEFGGFLYYKANDKTIYAYNLKK